MNGKSEYFLHEDLTKCIRIRQNFILHMLFTIVRCCLAALERYKYRQERFVS